MQPANEPGRILRKLRLMSIASWLRRLFARKRPKTFTLGKRGKPGIPGAREDVVAGRHEEKPPYGARRSEDMGQEKWEATTGPSEQDSWVLPENRQYLPHSTLGGMSREKRDLLSREIGRSLDETARTVMAIFHAPRNISLVHRLFELKSGRAKVRCALFYVEGTVDTSSIRSTLLKSLLDLNTGGKPFEVSAEGLARAIIPESLVRFGTTYAHLVHGLLTGQAVVVIDGEAKAIMADQRSLEHRVIEESPTEAVVRGPHTGFVENMYANLTLIRSQINSPDLVFERHFVGARAQAPLTIVYVEGIVNPKLVEETRRRLGAIATDMATPTALLARFVEDDPLSPVPGVMLTERPDRVASMLAEGHVALIDNAQLSRFSR